jgi:hypothetical protein
MPTPYRLLITGSRDWVDKQTVWDALAPIARALPADQDLVLVHGGCPTGADAMCDEWARGFGAVIERHRAEDFGPWPRCGPIRNRHMVSLGADEALAFIGPCTSSRCRKPRPHPSHGASNCADLAEQAGIPVRRFTA